MHPQFGCSSARLEYSSGGEWSLVRIQSPRLVKEVRSRMGSDLFLFKKTMKEDPRHIRISEYNYPLPDERIAKFPLPIRDQSKLLIYRRGK